MDFFHQFSFLPDDADFVYREYEEPRYGGAPGRYGGAPGIEKLYKLEDAPETLVSVKDPIDAAWDYFGDDIPREIFDDDRHNQYRSSEHLT